MGADVALVQEAGVPPADVAESVDTGPPEHWDSHIWNSRWWDGRFPNLFDRWPMVVKLSDRVEVEWFKQVSPISETAEGEIAVSGIDNIAAARVTPQAAVPFVAVSMYARWINPHACQDRGRQHRRGWLEIPLPRLQVVASVVSASPPVPAS